MKAAFCQKYEKSFPKAVECLEEGFEDSIQFYAFEELDSRKISSTNMNKGLNREIQSVIVIFITTFAVISSIVIIITIVIEEFCGTF